MATVRDICTRALRKAKVVAAGETPSAEQLSAALDLFLDIVENWRDEGIDLGINDTATVDTTIIADRGAFSALTFNLAVDCAIEEGVAISQGLTMRAERTKSSLANRQMGYTPVRFDPLLTRGTVYDIDAG